MIVGSSTGSTETNSIEKDSTNVRRMPGSWFNTYTSTSCQPRYYKRSFTLWWSLWTTLYCHLRRLNWNATRKHTESLMAYSNAQAMPWPNHTHIEACDRDIPSCMIVSYARYVRFSGSTGRKLSLVMSYCHTTRLHWNKKGFNPWNLQDLRKVVYLRLSKSIGAYSVISRSHGNLYHRLAIVSGSQAASDQESCKLAWNGL